ncbi:tetratricopeptide repeat protein [Actinospica durhamensis]|uniref:Tetratricopeptide repeat protein n=1 Tax=Actinospica durhamensis TaxID=1508375 RepID=A0A941IMW2_9ACTN|nr:tetratricopeptide repeat protein [Actinospica durhamensis]MBR7834675.1 tetratricopeptide repeat protein [Actinospica durhamensis]
MATSETHNDFHGSADTVVQTGAVSGGVHTHHHVHASALAGLVPRQLPVDTVHFTNREKEIARLDSWLKAPRGQASHVSLVVGVGGVGKTSLAAHWAHQVSEQFPDGNLYVDLHGYHNERSLTAEDALERLLRSFDIPAERIPPGLDDRVSLYRSLLHDKHILLLLDNASTVDQIRPLLPGSPTCRTLVTSRSAMPGLVIREGVKPLSISLLTPTHAAELIGRVAGHERVEREPDAAAALTRYCGYLPLALCIAAERLASHPGLLLEDLVEELAEERDRLDTLSTDGDDSSTVRVVFSWSYRVLPENEARMFRLLGLPSGPDVTAASAAVLFDTTLGRARRMLEALVRAHLLAEPTPGRYTLHDLLRVYAAECAQADEPAEQRAAALRRLFAWYAHGVGRAAAVIAPGFTSIPVQLPEPHAEVPAFPDRNAALRWCDTERENLVAAVRRAGAIGEHELAWQLPVVMFGFFIGRRPLADWVETHDIALASARRLGNRLAEAWLLTSSGIAHRDLRRYDAAISCLEQAITAWREVGEQWRWAEAWALRDLGGVYHELGRAAEAVETLENALAVHVAENDAWGEATASSMLAGAYQSDGRLDDALRSLRRALEIRQQEGDVRNVGRVLTEFGTLYAALGEHGQAIEALEQALEIHTELDSWHGEAVTREHLGKVYLQLGRHGAATEQWHRAIELFDRLGDPRSEDLAARLSEASRPREHEG